MLLRQHLDSKDEENLLLEVGSKYGVSICKRKQMRSLDLFANFLDQAKKWERKYMALIGKGVTRLFSHKKYEIFFRIGPT